MRPIAFVAAIAAALLTACSISTRHGTADAVVKVITEGGHGSGVHMGDRYLLTAAHVVGDSASVEVKSSTGEIHSAEVLWANTAYDVALLRVDDASGLGAVHLSCRTPTVGEHITAKGNPVNVEFVTVWGKIAGEVRELGPWRSVVVTDIVTVPGQSGGPVYDNSGKIVGITVGVMAARFGFGGSLVGMGYVVPGSVICGLMARGL